MSIFKEGIQVPKIVKPLEVIEYAPGTKELEGVRLYVWVNLTRNLLDEWQRLQVEISANNQEIDQTLGRIQQTAEALTRATKPKTISTFETELGQLNEKAEDLSAKAEALNNDMYAFYSQVWSQGPEGSEKPSPEEVRSVALESMNNDGGDFWLFMTKTTQAMILDHRNRLLKN